MISINNDKLQIAYNISYREFMFKTAVSMFEEKNGKLKENEKDDYRNAYYEKIRDYIEKFQTPEHREKDREAVCKEFDIQNADELTENHFKLYRMNHVERSLMPYLINATFSKKPNGEKTEPVYPWDENNKFTVEAQQIWQRNTNTWIKESDLSKGTTYAHLYNQFLFHRFIEDYNRNKIETGRSRDVITTSTAIRMSKVFDAKIKEEGEKEKAAIFKKRDFVATLSENEILSVKQLLNLQEADTLSSDEYARYVQYMKTPTDANTIMQALNEVFEDETGNPYFEKDKKQSVAKYLSLREQFFNLLDKEGGMEFENYIPLSPYDPLYSKREVFLRSGSQLVFVKKEELNEVTEDRNIHTYTYHRDKHIRATYDRHQGGVSTATRIPYANIDAYVSQRRYNLETENDRSGLSALLPYISKRELDGESIRSLNQYIDQQPMQYRISNEGIEKSVAILKHLQENGINYTIVKGYETGEIDAKITGTPYQIKIVAHAGNNRENLIGNIYNTKTTMNVSLSLVGGASREERLSQKYSIEDTLRMIDYTLGKNVEGVGTIGTYIDGNKEMNEAWYTGDRKKGCRFVLKNGNGNSRVQIKMDHNENYERPENFEVPGETLAKLNGNLGEIEKEKERYRQKAEDYLTTAIQTAKENFRNELQLENLIEEYKEHREEEDYVPRFSHDREIESIQSFYWNILQGQRDETADIEIPSDNEDRYKWTRLHLESYMENEFGSYEKNEEDGLRFDAYKVATYMSSRTGSVGNRENIIRAMKSLGITAKELRGTEYQNQMIENRMLRFNESSDAAKPIPMLHSQYPFVQEVGKTIKDTLLTTGCEVDESNILIDANGMIEIKASRWLRENRRSKSARKEDVTIHLGQLFVPDENGIIKTKFAGTENYATIPGNELVVLGNSQDGPLQERIRVRTYKDMIQEQTAKMVREALYSGEEHYENSTAYSAVYSKLKSEHFPLDHVEQMIKDGMEPEVMQAIIDTMRLQCTWANAEEIRDGATLMEDYKHSHMSEAADGTISSMQLNEAVNDNFRNVYDIMGRNNISQLGHWCDGAFDLSVTSGAKNQGINIYLNPDAKIAEDGSIIPAEDINKGVPIMKYMRYSEYDAWDRVQMTSSNFLRCLRVANKTKTAQMEFGGWTCDDGYVVSKEFANKYMVKGADGNMRPLQPGDKISDNHGNKGVISLIVDREENLTPIKRDEVNAETVHIDFDTFVYDKAFHKMTGTCTWNGKEYMVTTSSFRKEDIEDETKPYIQDRIVKQICDSIYNKESKHRENLEVPVAWFKANPELEVVSAPFSPFGRLNPGITKELDENPSELIDPSNPNRKIKNATGEADYIITAMTVDKKTHIYGEEEGYLTGRRASAQLGWALNSQGADKVMKELYGGNNASFENFREYLITFGLDIDEIGNFREKYTPQKDETRYIAGIQGIEEQFTHKKTRMPTGQRQEDKDKVYELMFNKRMQLKQHFARQLDTAGFMEIPFPIEMASGEKTQRLPNGNYCLPVLAKHLRSEQTFEDGRTSEHEYTKNYVQIYDSVLDYTLAKKNLDFLEQKQKDGKELTEEDKKELLKNEQIVNGSAMKKAQSSYDRVVDSLVERKFSTKENFIKEGLMSNKIKDSATAVWTGNPTLDIDQVAVSPDIAKNVGLVDNGYALIWRDPLLRDGGVRYMRVKIDENLKSCISINPAMDKSYDGDFDGDTIGVVKLSNKESIEQAKKLLSVEANLLDHGTGGEGQNKSLASHEDLDIKSVEYGNPEIREIFSDITEEINRVEERFKDEPETLQAERIRLKDKLSELYKLAFSSAYIDEEHNPNGCYNVWDKAQEEHIQQLMHTVETGAKGSIGKLKEYSQYLGVAFETEINENGEEKIIDGSLRVYDKPFGMYEDTTPDKDGKPFNQRFADPVTGKVMTAEEASRTKKLNTQIATSVKSVGTGIAGAYSQRGIRALRNLCPRAILEMTYPETQGVLQAKHDEEEARIKFDALMGLARKAWNAEKLQSYYPENSSKKRWRAVTNEKNEPIKVTYGEFIEQLKEICASEDALNVKVNADYIREIAGYMVDPKDKAEKIEKYGSDFDITKCRMLGIEDEEFLKQYESPMDRLAYSYGNGRETIEILKELADPKRNDGKMRNLYEGKNNAMFMPSNVRYNQEVQQAARENNTEEMRRTKEAISRIQEEARQQGQTYTREKIANEIIERGESSYAKSTIEKAVSEVNKESNEKKLIQPKETRAENVVQNQQRLLRKQQDKLNLSEIQVDMTKDVEPGIPVNVAVVQDPHQSAIDALDPEFSQMIDEIMENGGAVEMEVSDY